jgi:hypothetical protein
MFTERLQILVSREQRRRLEAEAERRGTSVAALVGEALDARFGAADPGARLRAVGAIAGMRGRFLPPEELERVLERERAAR